jgi:Flp pilus assembly pilin Flp
MSSPPGKADSPDMRPSRRTDRIRSWRREEGQTMSEYVVVLAVITPIVLLAFGSLSSAVLSALDQARSFL